MFGSTLFVILSHAVSFRARSRSESERFRSSPRETDQAFPHGLSKQSRAEAVTATHLAQPTERYDSVGVAHLSLLKPHDLVASEWS